MSQFGKTFDLCQRKYENEDPEIFDQEEIEEWDEDPLYDDPDL